MAAAVIKLDALPDAIRAGTQDHDLFAIARVGLILIFVGRIKIWSERFKLCAAGVDALEDGTNTHLVPDAPHVVFSRRKQGGELLIGKARPFGLEQRIARDRVDTLALQLTFERDDLLKVIEEPRINLSQVVQLF